MVGAELGTHERLWTWQQEEAVRRGPWQITCLAAAMEGPRVWRWRQQQWSSMRRRYIGAYGRLGAWQQL
ncbi:unnamed protein product [Staurois parvus]|uniref:Uncharacterized protein n=1 Tax=Staurois parvus TaxID=386267 RepID=A0ABN9CSY9_9NEOB|nr:unnamed protein product [Staurois parvus]